MGRALWETAGIATYEFSIEYFAAWGKPPPMRIAVSDQTVRSALLLCLPPNTEEFCRSWQDSRKGMYGPDRLMDHARSITQLLDDAAARSKQNPSARVLLEVDPTYGFPVRLSIDDLDTDDDEYGFPIFEFQPNQ